MPQPYKLFTIYAREDAQYLEELRGQLRPLEHAGRIKVWSDREINPGVDWEREIVQNLDTADIILILVSAAYYNSAYIHEKEITHALNRHEKGEAKVLPVIVRPCSFLDDPVISRLQVLPTDGKPVTSHHWRERDDAWLDVVAGVKRTIDLLRNAELQREQAIQNKKEEEKRTRDEQARYEREANERAENERLAQLRREQEQAARRAELNAWQQAADDHNIPAYENYLARYPQGEYAREARARIKELKRKMANPVAWERPAIIGGGVLAVVLLAWLVSNMFGGRDPQLSESSQLSENSPASKDTTQFVSVEKPKQDTTAPKTIFKDPFERLMVRVAGGTFTMVILKGEGSLEDCPSLVKVGSFSIGKYEVTQAQWRSVMGKNPSKHKQCEDCPVGRVSWNDVKSFIKKLNEKTSKNYRLPTESEWEYAARGGNKSLGYKYAGSDDVGSVAWYEANSGSKTHPVGGKSPNELGLYDMSGNVWEWCQDFQKPYPGCKETGFEGPYRVIRGGGCLNSDWASRATNRGATEPVNRGDDYGFRLAL